jgi:hypothetical protein
VETKRSSSFPFPFVPLQRRGCLVAPWFIWIVLVPCGWLVQRQGWRVKGWIWSSEQARSARTRGRGNFVYSSLWDFKSSFTCRKILRHGTFPLYFPSVCCGFLSPLKIHRLGRVLNPKLLGPVASTLTTTPRRRPGKKNKRLKLYNKITFTEVKQGPEVQFITIITLKTSLMDQQQGVLCWISR